MYLNISKFILFNKFKLLMIERLKKRLESSGVDFDDFCQVLIKNKAFLSGSFLLQVIQNKYYNDVNSDIDIYTIGNKNKILEKDIDTLLKNALMTNFNNNITKIRELANLEILSLNKNIGHEETYFEDGYISESEIGYRKFNQKNYSARGEIQTVNLFTNNYKGIINYGRSELDIVELEMYRDIKINDIVNFVTDTIIKYQLIYCNEQNYKTFKNIVDNFDFDFCSNYFDGKKIYIKNYNSIIKSSCTLRLKKPRIFKNQNNRIIKYLNRGFNINIKYNNDIYHILYIKSKIITKRDYVLTNNIKNLAIFCSVQIDNIDDILNNLPIELEKLIIYTYPHNTIIDNLPTSLKELRMYIWNVGHGLENGNVKHHQPFTDDYAYVKDKNKKNNMYIKTTMDNLKKIPFNCEVYINDELIDT